MNFLSGFGVICSLIFISFGIDRLNENIKSQTAVLQQIADRGIHVDIKQPLDIEFSKAAAVPDEALQPRGKK